MRFTTLCLVSFQCCVQGIKSQRHSIENEVIIQKTVLVDGLKREECYTSAPTTGPTQHDMCPVLVLNFNDLTPGDYIHDQLWLSHGVNITAIRKNSLAGFTPINGVHVESGGGAMVFDTLTPTGKTGQSLCDPYDGDTDLGSPNEACSGGGAGTGPGGRPTFADGTPNPYENCQPLGNVLVIQESDKSCPDDSWAGGWLQFDFRVPTEVLFVKLLDIDEGITPKIEVWQNRALQGTIFETSTTGDNGLWNQTIALENAIRLRIEYHGSGSLAELLYRYCPPN